MTREFEKLMIKNVHTYSQCVQGEIALSSCGRIKLAEYLHLSYVTRLKVEQLFSKYCHGSLLAKLTSPKLFLLLLV